MKMDSDSHSVEHTRPPQFLEWAREIQALSQTGYLFAADDYQRERCRRLTEIAAEIIRPCG